MAQDFGLPPHESKSYSWSEVWISALTKPTVSTYEHLVHDPTASPNKAYGWVFFCSMIAYATTYLIGLVIRNLFDTSGFGGFGSAPYSGVSSIWLVCCAPLVGVLAVLGLALQAGLTQLIARMLGGTGSYSELVYGFAAYSAPLSLLTGIIYAIPIINLCLSIPLAIYSLALFVIAINAVNQFGWGKAIASAIIIPVLLIMLISCSVITILTLLGPTIGNVFSEIMRELATPVSFGV